MSNKIYQNLLGLVIFCTPAYAIKNSGYQSDTTKIPLNIQRSTSLSHIVKTVYRKKGADPADTSYLNTYDVRQEITYLDGLGRPIQIISPKASPSLKDIVQPIIYDEFGRQPKKYLPYTSGNDGSYKANALTTGQGLYAFYNNTGQSYALTSHPYAESIYDGSPLGRTVEQGGAGAAWQPYNVGIANSGHTIKTESLSNTTNEVRIWQSSGGTISSPGYYAAGKLYKAITKDADWISGKAGTAEIFTDLAGRTILKRKHATETDAYDTYYVYNLMGQLTYMLPPAINATSITVGDTLFNQYVYAYKYDQRGRVIEKKEPGTGWVHIVYNTLNFPVLTQDSIQRENGIWNYIKYDAKGRTIITGKYISFNGRSILQTTVDANTSLFERRTNNSDGYTEDAFPIGTTAEIFYFFDDYSLPENCPWLLVPSYANKVIDGLPTATKVAVDGSLNYLWSIYYYDDQNRLIESYKQNQLDGYERTQMTYSANGDLITNVRTHINNRDSKSITLTERHSYDHVGRLLKNYHKVNTQAEVLMSVYNYNELGQLIEKNLHSENDGNSFLQSVDYRYNIQGKLASINNAALSNDAGITNNDSNDLFGLELKYESGLQLGSSGYYNGNIAESIWNTSRTAKKRAYAYTYDKLDRIATANFYANNGNWSGDVENGRYNLNGLSYDKMGNITQLSRYGLIGSGAFGLRDQLSYIYNGSKLVAVTDAGSSTYGFKSVIGAEYHYNGSGRLIADFNKKLTSINYSDNGNLIWVEIEGYEFSQTYQHTAKGEKLSHFTVTGNMIDYVGGMGEYVDGMLSLIYTPEGRILPSGSNFIYEYFIMDHQGNTRVVFGKNPVTGLAEIVQEDHYYPFGGKMEGLLYVGTQENKYLYGGKEQQEYTQWYDFGPRMYDADLGRWHFPDLLASDFVDYSPYSYAFNNPVYYTDPSGMAPEDPPSKWDGTLPGITIYNNGYTPPGGWTYTGAGRTFGRDYSNWGQWGSSGDGSGSGSSSTFGIGSVGFGPAGKDPWEMAQYDLADRSEANLKNAAKIEEGLKTLSTALSDLSKSELPIYFGTKTIKNTGALILAERTAKVMGRIGYIGALVQGGSDYVQFRNGKISEDKLKYRLTGNLASTLSGLANPLAGVYTSTIVTGLENAYDGILPYYNRFINNINYGWTGLRY